MDLSPFLPPLFFPFFPGADPDHFAYVYDRAGNVTDRTNMLNGDFSETYDYDALDRLTDADRADSFDQSWDLDGLGNFSGFDDDGTSQTRTTNAANEITDFSNNWIDPSYDAAGNRISGPQTGSETVKVHYVYDAWNRLVAVKADSGGVPGDVIATFVYDGANRRTGKFGVNGDGHEYYYNTNWQVIEDREVDAYGEIDAVNDYIWSLRASDTPAICLRDSGGPGTYDFYPDGDVTDAYPKEWSRYYLTDANGNVTTTIRYDNYYGYIPWQGDTVGRNVYSAYGELTDQLNASWTNSNVEVAFDGPLYCGYWFDTDTGLYQVRNRYYDPGLSTWINRDPIGYSGGTSNLYCYCGCNPTNRIDPNGTTILSHSKIDTYLTQYVVGVGHKTSANEWLYSEVTANAAGNALRTEILTRMIKSTYQFHVKGTTEKECLDNIKKNVESRVNILRLAEAKKYGFGAGSAYHENSTVPGLNYKTNPLAYFNSINNAGTTIACQFATMLTFYAGIGTWGANSGSRMLSGIEDVIPGDWSYIYNDANNTNKTGLQDPNWEPGLEGENVIYVGANRFWGHISGEQVVETWQQWFADMRAWKSKDGTQSGKPRMDRDVKFSTLGLQ